MPNFTQFRCLSISCSIAIASSLGFSSLAKAEVRGLYGSDCLSIDGLSAKKDLLFKDKTLETVQTVYSDDVCDSPAYDFSFVGSYALNPSVDANGLDYSYTSIKLRPIDARVAVAFNEIALCGFSDWTMDESKEVAGSNCGGQKIPTTGTTVFDIVQESADSAYVQLGQSNEIYDGLSAGKRPIDLDSLIYHAR
jgi:hypothetical protein